MHLKQQNQFDAGSSVHEQLTEEEIEKFITSSNIQPNGRTYQHALHFLTILKNSPKLVAWNSKGEISFSRGQFIPGSSIKDIVICLFRNIHYPEPVAFQRILNVMKFLKIPPNLVLNKSASFLYNVMYNDTGFVPRVSTLNSTVAGNVSQSSANDSNIGILFEALKTDDEVE